MSEWNAEQYLKFQKQRTQPAVDLVKRISVSSPQSVLDVGCGPGNSTRVLKEAFPDAHILGIDNSENMIRKAQTACPDLAFRLVSAAEICRENEKYDVIFSNACLQWVPEHEKIIPMLCEKLNKQGVLAVQMPMNAQEPLFKIMDETVKENKWNFASLKQEPNTTLPCENYFDILSSITDTFDIWETIYYHQMPSIDAMIEWIKGTRLRPYLNALNETDSQALIGEIAQKAASVYKRQKNGEFLLKFRRLFFTAAM